MISRARGEVGRHPALVEALLGHRPDPAGDLGDHAQGALGAQHQLAQRRAGGRVRASRRVRSDPDGRGQLDRGDQLVEAPVAARGLAGRAGGGEAADRRLLEGLREVPERHARARPAPPRPRGRAGPGPSRAVSEVRSRSTARSAARSSETTAEWAPATASRPPTTLDPPPKGTTATPLGAGLEHRRDLLGRSAGRGPRRGRARACRCAAGPGPDSCAPPRGAGGPRRRSAGSSPPRRRAPRPGAAALRAARPARARPARSRRRARRRARRAARPGRLGQLARRSPSPHPHHLKASASSPRATRPATPLEALSASRGCARWPAAS